MFNRALFALWCQTRGFISIYIGRPARLQIPTSQCAGKQTRPVKGYSLLWPTPLNLLNMATVWYSPFGLWLVGGGYLIVRKSRAGWFPHFLWCADLADTKVLHFTPRKVASWWYRPIHMLWFSGVIKCDDLWLRFPERSALQTDSRLAYVPAVESERIAVIDAGMRRKASHCVGLALAAAKPTAATFRHWKHSDVSIWPKCPCFHRLVDYQPAGFANGLGSGLNRFQMRNPGAGVHMTVTRDSWETTVRSNSSHFPANPGHREKSGQVPTGPPQFRRPLFLSHALWGTDWPRAPWPAWARC